MKWIGEVGLGMIVSVCFLFLDALYFNSHRKESASAEAISEIKKRVYAITTICISCLIGLALRKYGLDALHTVRLLAIWNGVWFLAVIDRMERIIPNRYIILLAALGIGITTAQSMVLIVNNEGIMPLWISSIMGLVVCTISMAAGYVISRHGIGGGDVKLLAVIGFYFGYYRSMTLLFLALLIAAGYSVVQIIRRKITVKDSLPFAPYLAVAMTIVLLLGM